MSAAIKCPCCAEPLDIGAAVCPRCGLKGLDQIVLSRAAYLQWRQEVLEPYKVSYRPPIRLFDSRGDYALILRGDRLYGLGSNRSGQLGDFDENDVTVPRLMARRVKSAAAGYTYSIYTTLSGGVKLVGRGEYADRPIEFSGVSEVYAHIHDDIFWIKDYYGQTFGFGNNISSNIQELEETCLYKFPPKTYYCTGNCIMDISSGPRPQYDVGGRLRWQAETECMSTDIYNQLVAKYPNQYCYIDAGRFDIQGGPRYTSTSDRSCQLEYTATATISPKLMLSNRRIYVPVKTVPVKPQDLHGFYLKPSYAYLHESCPETFPSEEGDCKRILMYDISYGENIWLVLDMNGTLSMYRCDGDCSVPGWKLTFLGAECNKSNINEVVGYRTDVGGDYIKTILLSTLDGRLFQIKDLKDYVYSNGKKGFEELIFPEEV